MSNPFDLTGRVAIVTGSGSGIGKASALTLASQGARVFGTDIDHAAALATASEAAGGAIVALEHDVTSQAGWDAVFAAVSETGRLDILVNNAGIMLAVPFEQSTIADLRKQQSVNVESVWMGMHGAIAPMKKTVAQFGSTASIINVSSVYGQVGGAAFAAYSASKGAVRTLSKAVAAEMAQAGIRVNSIHPGPVATNLGAKWDPPVDAEGRPLSPEEALAMWTRLIPMNRLGGVDDIAPVIAFLASDAARFMTGAEVAVDGGYIAV